jgi:hypothetical protein
MDDWAGSKGSDAVANYYRPLMSLPLSTSSHLRTPLSTDLYMHWGYAHFRNHIYTLDAGMWLHETISEARSLPEDGSRFTTTGGRGV